MNSKISENKWKKTKNCGCPTALQRCLALLLSLLCFLGEDSEGKEMRGLTFSLSNHKQFTSKITAQSLSELSHSDPNRMELFAYFRQNRGMTSISRVTSLSFNMQDDKDYPQLDILSAVIWEEFLIEPLARPNEQCRSEERDTTSVSRKRNWNKVVRMNWEHGTKTSHACPEIEHPQAMSRASHPRSTW